MTARLLDHWAPPAGFRLASVIATTYELQVDFLEEDVLPVALDLRTSPARGRDFRVELERALSDTEVSILFHPERYRAGLRRTPRIDLVPLPEPRFPKLHAKVSLLRFVPTGDASPARQVVRLIVGSANLTHTGYRTNVEVAVALDDGPGATPEVVTAVRDAAEWLRRLTEGLTSQLDAQLRDLRAVAEARPVAASRDHLAFVALPRAEGLPPLLRADGALDTLWISSPFWPEGEAPDDVIASIERGIGALPSVVRLCAMSDRDDAGGLHPVIPSSFVRAWQRRGVIVDLAPSDPAWGGAPDGREGHDAGEDDDYSEVAGRRSPTTSVHRDLHAKVLLLEHENSATAAIGSFNLTRRGLGLVPSANLEAGLVYRVPKREAVALRGLFAMAGPWRRLSTDLPADWIREPPPRQGEAASPWPSFLVALRARRDGLELEGDASSWPASVTIRMRDIRGRLHGEEAWFDSWTVQRPAETMGTFRASMQFVTMAGEDTPDTLSWPALPDLEAELSWPGGTAVVPVLFVDKHTFPVVEKRTLDDERALIEWFLGLRPADESDGDGFGHGIDPAESVAAPVAHFGQILSYLVRDFVHALPGIRARIKEAGLTETGLRSALLGSRSPVRLAHEVVNGWRNPRGGAPKKTAVATAFQLVELMSLLRDVPLPPLAEGASERLREEALSEIRARLTDVVSSLEQPVPGVLGRYLTELGGMDADA